MTAPGLNRAQSDRPAPKRPTARSRAPEELLEHYARRVEPQLASMPWLLRVTEHRKRPSPVLVIKSRRPLDEAGEEARVAEHGILYGDSLRRCLPGIRRMLARVRDVQDRLLDLHQFLQGPSIAFRGNLPLDEGTGSKLALLFRLQERVQDLDRVELIARRIDSFTTEEATYWLSRILHFNRPSNRWAIAGMRIMLGGLPGDPAIGAMLRELTDRDRDQRGKRT